MPFFLLLIAVCGADAPSYRLEVQPILVRAGCSSGPCHGNLNGKGGFKLSLRGEDPAFDQAMRETNPDEFDEEDDEDDE